MQILSYAFSLAGLACMLIASLIKGSNMKTILLLVFSGSVLVATSYLVGGNGLNGAASCYLGAVQSIVNYFFNSKNRAIPKWLIGVYAVAFVVLNLVVGGLSWAGLIAIVASLTFVLCIGQENGAKYRFWSFINMSLWCLYDVVSLSFSALITHGTQLITAAVGMLIHDRKQKAE